MKPIDLQVDKICNNCFQGKGGFYCIEDGGAMDADEPCTQGDYESGACMIQQKEQFK